MWGLIALIGTTKKYSVDAYLASIWKTILCISLLSSSFHFGSDVSCVMWDVLALDCWPGISIMLTSRSGLCWAVNTVTSTHSGAKCFYTNIWGLSIQTMLLFNCSGMVSTFITFNARAILRFLAKVNFNTYTSTDIWGMCDLIVAWDRLSLCPWLIW